MNLSTAVLQTILPRAPVVWLGAMVDNLPRFGIDTPHEVASFLSQMAVETNEFTRLEENLNYSASRMAQVWKRFAANPEELDFRKRLPNTLAARYEHAPEQLANFIYANRMGNGDEASGDGWRFHGRGPQLTGRGNYTRCAAWIGHDIVTYPELLLSPITGIRAACWYWLRFALDGMDDDDDVRAETRAFNGGETGLAQRQTYFNLALPILEAA